MTRSKAKQDPETDRTVEQESGEVTAVDDSGVPAPEGNPDLGLVTIKLAHRLRREQDLVYLGLAPDRSYGVNDEVQVTKEAARALINAGLAQVDPADRAAVSEVLGVTAKTK